MPFNCRISSNSRNNINYVDGRIDLIDIPNIVLDTVQTVVNQSIQAIGQRIDALKMPDVRLANRGLMDFSQNQLTELTLPVHPNYSNLDPLPVDPNLRLLNLSKNQLMELNLPMLPNLQSLDLSWNQLTRLILPKQPNLFWIDLSHNQLTDLHLSEQPELLEIDLSYNQLTKLTLPVQPSLRTLDLSSNRLRELTLPVQPKLLELDLCCNRLTNLTLHEQPDLRELNLSQNRLTALNFPMPPNLWKLDLSDNQLTELPDSILSLTREATVFVRGNLFLHQYIHAFRQRIIQHRQNHPGEGPQFLGLEDSLEDVATPDFIVDIEALSNDPIPIFKNYFETISRNNGVQPRIRFRQGENFLPGQDVGGLTRDFITQLFSALRPKENGNSPLYLKEENGLYFPKVHLPISEIDKDSYKAIGMIYAFALNPQDLNQVIKTGPFFHPAVFAMIRSLTAEEADWIPENFDPENTDAVRDLMPQETYNKLLKMYLRHVYPVFNNDENMIHQFIHSPHIPPLAWQVPNLEEQFDFNAFTSEFNTIVLPILMIAKSMLHFRVDWADINESTVEDLQKNIQGHVTDQIIIEEITHHLALDNTSQRQKQDCFIQWIKEMAHSEEMLKKLCYAVSGSPYLHPLEITDAHPQDGPVFHTCTRSIDLPHYDNYDAFKEAFTVAVNAAQDAGFNWDE